MHFFSHPFWKRQIPWNIRGCSNMFISDEDEKVVIKVTQWKPDYQKYGNGLQNVQLHAFFLGDLQMQNISNTS